LIWNSCRNDKILIFNRKCLVFYIKNQFHGQGIILTNINLLAAKLNTYTLKVHYYPRAFRIPIKKPASQKFRIGILVPVSTIIFFVFKGKITWLGSFITLERVAKGLSMPFYMKPIPLILLKNYFHFINSSGKVHGNHFKGSFEVFFFVAPKHNHGGHFWIVVEKN